MKRIKKTEEEQLRGCLEDILNDITEYNVKGDIEYFLDCWKDIIKYSLDYRSDAQ